MYLSIIHIHLHTVASPPLDLMAIQDGLTSIAISWVPPTPLGDTTGYTITYTGASSSGSVTVSAVDNTLFPDDSGSGGMPSNLVENYTLTGLQNGDTYNISVVAISQHLPSDSLEVTVLLCELRNNYYSP